MEKFELHSEYKATGDQPEAIAALSEGILRGDKEQTLLGVTGSGKTFTMANIIANVNKPTLVLAHNKTLATIITSRRSASEAVAEWRRRSISSLIELSFSI